MEPHAQIKINPAVVVRINAFQTPCIFQIDQCVDRTPTAINSAPCVMPRGQYFLSKQLEGFGGRCLSCREMLRLQGIGDEEMLRLGYTLPEAARYAGESFAAPVFCAILLGALKIAWPSHVS